MEIRATAVPPEQGAYVDTSIPKVAETPLEGSDASAPETFGPFQDDDPATMAKTPNSKGHSVRFQEPRVDPIEQAFDSIIIFIDDVREASNVPRGDGKGKTGLMNAVLEVTKTLDCVAECRNPCADPCDESFGKMQPPADLMLNVNENSGPIEEEKYEEQELREEAAAEISGTPEFKQAEEEEAAAAAALAKQNSVKDLSVAPPSEDAKDENETNAAVNPKAVMPTYSPVETIADKIRTLIPEDVLLQVMDAFVIKTGEVRPDAAELTIKRGIDSDPVVEVIDRLIMLFDDLQEALLRVQKDHKTATLKGTGRFSASGAGETKTEEPHLESDYDRSGDTTNTTLSEDTMKTANTKKVKPLYTQMSPAEYQEALSSAAEMLSQTAVNGISTLSKEELHKQAVERIMAERPDEEGFTDYKTEAMILEELMRDADQTIMDARSKSTEEKESDSKHAEELVVLGHSATLTPIPEADEASAGTPASDMIEQGVITGAIPQVPLPPAVQPETKEESKKEEESPPAVSPAEAPAEKDKAETEADGDVAIGSAGPAAESADVVSSNQSKVQEPEGGNEEQPKLGKQTPVEEEKDPIIYFIDLLFLLCDDLQQRKECEGCLGAPVPSDLVDRSDEIVEAEGTGGVVTEEEKKSQEAKIEPRLDGFETVDSRGQLMLKEALKLVQQATKISETVSQGTTGDAANSDLVEKLAETIDDAERAAMMKDAPTSKLVDIEKKIITAHGIELPDTEKNRAIAKLVEAAFEESGEKLRSTWNAIVENPDAGTKGKDPTVVTPQMSLEMENEKPQAKVEFEIPELMKHNQDPCIAWGGDDSELMASINADRKLSEMEHENIFRDVSKGLQESAGAIITRADNPDVFSIYKAPAFTEGNSSSAELPDDRVENPAQASISCGESENSGAKGQQTVAASQSSEAGRARDTGKSFAGWSLSKKREEMLRTRLANPNSI